jgi:hypothetical protein
MDRMHRIEPIDPPSRGLSLGVKTTALVVAISVVVLIGELAVHEAGVTRISAPAVAEAVATQTERTGEAGEHYPGRYTLHAIEPDAPVPTF